MAGDEYQIKITATPDIGDAIAQVRSELSRLQADAAAGRLLGPAGRGPPAAAMAAARSAMQSGLANRAMPFLAAAIPTTLVTQGVAAYGDLPGTRIRLRQALEAGQIGPEQYMSQIMRAAPFGGGAVQGWIEGLRELWADISGGTTPLRQEIEAFARRDSLRSERALRARLVASGAGAMAAAMRARPGDTGLRSLEIEHELQRRAFDLEFFELPEAVKARTAGTFEATRRQLLAAQEMERHTRIEELMHRRRAIESAARALELRAGRRPYEAELEEIEQRYREARRQVRGLGPEEEALRRAERAERRMLGARHEEEIAQMRARARIEWLEAAGRPATALREALLESQRARLVGAGSEGIRQVLGGEVFPLERAALEASLGEQRRRLAGAARAAELRMEGRPLQAELAELAERTRIMLRLAEEPEARRHIVTIAAQEQRAILMAEAARRMGGQATVPAVEIGWRFRGHAAMAESAAQQRAVQTIERIYAELVRQHDVLEEIARGIRERGLDGIPLPN